MQQGLELLKLGAPTTIDELRGDILKEKNAQTKFYMPVYNAVSSRKLRATLDKAARRGPRRDAIH